MIQQVFDLRMGVQLVLLPNCFVVKSDSYSRQNWGVASDHVFPVLISQQRDNNQNGWFKPAVVDTQQSVMSSAQPVTGVDGAAAVSWRRVTQWGRHWDHQVVDKIELVTSPILADYNGSRKRASGVVCAACVMCVASKALRLVAEDY